MTWGFCCFVFFEEKIALGVLIYASSLTSCFHESSHDLHVLLFAFFFL